jgi:hypothetical protein
MADISTTKTLELAGRHRLIVEQTEEGNALRLITPDGSIPVTIEITSRGVALRIDSPGISLHATGDLDISAERLSLLGRSELVLASGGDLELTAARDLHSRAQAHVVRAHAGGVDIKASDDVRLAGERVLVNCDETVDLYYRPPPR